MSSHDTLSLFSFESLPFRPRAFCHLRAYHFLFVAVRLNAIEEYFEVEDHEEDEEDWD